MVYSEKSSVPEKIKERFLIDGKKGGGVKCLLKGRKERGKSREGVENGRGGGGGEEIGRACTASRARIQRFLGARAI